MPSISATTSSVHPIDWLRLSDAAWRAAYAHECDNVRAALDWTFGQDGDYDLGIGLARASVLLWRELSLHAEGQRRIDTASTYKREHSRT